MLRWIYTLLTKRRADKLVVVSYRRSFPPQTRWFHRLTTHDLWVIVYDFVFL